MPVYKRLCYVKMETSLLREKRVNVSVALETRQNGFNTAEGFALSRTFFFLSHFDYVGKSLTTNSSVC